MKTLYIDCGMGAAGDMLAGALLELLPEPDMFIKNMNDLKIPGVELALERAVKCGITGAHFCVKVNGVEEDEHLHNHHDHDHHHHDHCHNHDHNHANHHHHSSLDEIRHIIGHMQIPDKVKADVIAVYDLIAEAESHVHGVPVTQIHFHEVGTMDAVADITAVCMLMYALKPDEIIASPIHVGSGTVRCAHGVLPVPAPATAYLLRDIPVYSGCINGELCTPTGAALLRHFVSKFHNMPMMKITNIGYGMGKKDFDRANCVRAMLGETDDRHTDQVIELSCNVDDMTGEAIGFAMEQLMQGGAMDIFTTPINMKKSRPGTLICVLCRMEDKDNVVRLIFKHTTTLGIRENTCNRYILDRTVETVSTPYGEIRRKDSRGYGVMRSKYEYDDISRIAKENDLSLQEVQEKILSE